MSLVLSQLIKSKPIKFTLDSVNEFRTTYITQTLSTYSNALSTLVDGLLTHQSTNPAMLSLGTDLSYGALYKGLSKGKIGDLESLLIKVTSSLPRVFALDVTNIEKPKSKTSPQRVKLHSSGGWKSHITKFGWKLHLLSRLTPRQDSWSLPIKASFIPPGASLLDETMQVIRELCLLTRATLTNPVVLLLDAGYPIAKIIHLVREEGLGCIIIGRVSSNSVFYKDGSNDLHVRKPHIYGTRVDKDTTWSEASLQCQDEYYGAVSVKAYFEVFPKVTRSDLGIEKPTPIPQMKGTLIKAKVSKIGKRRVSKPMNLLTNISDFTTELELLYLVTLYLKRFEIEHLFRFLKHNMGLTKYKAMDKGSYENWIKVMMLAYTQLWMLSSVVKDLRLPWEKKVDHLSPYRVKRVINLFVCNLVKSTKKGYLYKAGPGWPKKRKRRRRKVQVVLTAKKIAELQQAS